MKKAYWLLSLAILIIIGALAISPDKYIVACQNGLLAWATVVLPAIFPFLFFTKILTDLGVVNTIASKFTIFSKIFKSPPIGAYAFSVSILSGYPVGAKIVSDLYENGTITREEAFKMTTYTSNSGPMFILGSVGIGMLFSRTLGLIMLFSHVMSALLNGLLYRNYKFKKPQKVVVQNLKNTNEFSLKETMWNSVSSILIIGGFICIFFVVIEIFNNLYIFVPISNFFSYITGVESSVFIGVFNGILEMTHGCLDICHLPLSPATAGVICCGLITFGGLATVLQALVFLGKFKMKLGFFFMQKISQTIIAMSICFVLCLIFVGF